VATVKIILLGSVDSFLIEHYDTCSMILFLPVMINSSLFCRHLFVEFNGLAAFSAELQH
jgi:hypothetical protein